MKTPATPPVIPSLLAYRQTLRTCHQLGVCLHPESSCPKHCRAAEAMQALPPLAPGVLDGPYHRVGHRWSPGERASRVLLLALCVAAAVVVLVQLYGVVV